MSFFSKIFLIFIFTVFLNIPTKTFAQTELIRPGDIPELKEKVYYNVSPSKPNIGDNVELEAQMYGTPVKNSIFVWKIDGVIFKEGGGENRANFTLSKKTKIDLKITTESGFIIERSFDFDPKKIIIIWESRTYTPPFYKGKSFFTPESTVILNAINLDQENPLTNKRNNYVWKRDSTVLGKQSGVGYSSLAHEDDILGIEPLFKVTLSNIKSFNDTSTSNNSFNNEALLRVRSLPTEIISYEKSPLLGVLFNKTIKNTYSLDKTETTIVSYPLNYSFSSLFSGLYTWYINDVKINTSINEISFKKRTSNERSRLTLDIKNENAILQNKTVTYIVETSGK